MAELQSLSPPCWEHPLSSTNMGNKSVSFNVDHVATHFYSSHVKPEQTWFSKREYEIIHNRDLLTYLLYEANSFLESEEHTMRGLEKPRSAVLKKSTLKAVLSEQERQRKRNIHDERTLAIVAKCKSKVDRRKAVKRAYQDANEAQQIQAENPVYDEASLSAADYESLISDLSTSSPTRTLRRLSSSGGLTPMQTVKRIVQSAKDLFSSHPSKSSPGLPPMIPSLDDDDHDEPSLRLHSRRDSLELSSSHHSRKEKLSSEKDEKENQHNMMYWARVPSDRLDATPNSPKKAVKRTIIPRTEPPKLVDEEWLLKSCELIGSVPFSSRTLQRNLSAPTDSSPHKTKHVIRRHRSDDGNILPHVPPGIGRTHSLDILGKNAVAGEMPRTPFVMKKQRRQSLGPARESLTNSMPPTEKNRRRKSLDFLEKAMMSGRKSLSGNLSVASERDTPPPPIRRRASRRFGRSVSKSDSSSDGSSSLTRRNSLEFLEKARFTATLPRRSSGNVSLATAPEATPTRSRRSLGPFRRDPPSVDSSDTKANSSFISSDASPRNTPPTSALERFLGATNSSNASNERIGESLGKIHHHTPSRTQMVNPGEHLKQPQPQIVPPKRRSSLTGQPNLRRRASVRKAVKEDQPRKEPSLDPVKRLRRRDSSRILVGEK